MIVFVHHTLDDSDTSLLDADKMLAILTRHRYVKAVFYGHSHAYNYKTLDGMHLVNLPAVGYNFVDSEPVGWVEATMDAKGAQLALHAFAGNREQDGQTRKSSGDKNLGEVILNLIHPASNRSRYQALQAHQASIRVQRSIQGNIDMACF